MCPFFCCRGAYLRRGVVYQNVAHAVAVQPCLRAGVALNDGFDFQVGEVPGRPSALPRGSPRPRAGLCIHGPRAAGCRHRKGAAIAQNADDNFI